MEPLIKERRKKKKDRVERGVRHVRTVSTKSVLCRQKWNYKRLKKAHHNLSFFYPICIRSYPTSSSIPIHAPLVISYITLVPTVWGKKRKKKVAVGIFLVYVPLCRFFVLCSIFPLLQLLQVRRRECLNHTRSFTEACTEDAIGVLEHAVLQTHNNKL